MKLSMFALWKSAAPMHKS